jgi:hypothetical protein
MPMWYSGHVFQIREMVDTWKDGRMDDGQMDGGRRGR